jgi:hypothetical protein
MSLATDALPLPEAPRRFYKVAILVDICCGFAALPTVAVVTS